MQSSPVYICNSADQLGYIGKKKKRPEKKESGRRERKAGVIFIPRKCFDHTGVYRGFIELN